jgi:hypothetical protein
MKVEAPHFVMQADDGYFRERGQDVEKWLLDPSFVAWVVRLAS